MQRNEIVPEIKIDNIKYPNTQMICVLETDGSEIIEGTAEDFVIPMGRTVILTNAFVISKNFINSYFMNAVLKKNGLNKVLSDVCSWYDAAYFCNELSKLCELEPVYTFNNLKKNRKKNAIVESAEVTTDLTKNGFRLPSLAETDLAFKVCKITPYYQVWCNDCFSSISNDETVFDPTGEETGNLRTTAQTNGIGKLKYSSIDITKDTCFNFRVCRNITE